MTSILLEGTLTALVTPFTADASQLDLPAFERLVEAQLQGGVSGLVACGTTGETPTMTEDEDQAVISTAVRLARGKVPVIAGTGSNSTATTIEASRRAVELGADCVMVVMPYYNKPSQEGLVRHVQLVSAAVDVPVMVYNIPGRTGVNLSVDSTLRVLDTCPNVVAIKDATGGLAQCQELLEKAGDCITVLCGDDGLTIPMMSVGARGVVSVSSNVLPAAVSAVTKLALAGDYAKASKAHLRLMPLHRVMFAEPNPAPAKAALAGRGMMTAAVRSPLIEASDATKQAVARVLEELDR